MAIGYVDGASHLALAEIEGDIAESLRATEVRKIADVRLVDSQPEITWEMRLQLLEFLAQAQAALELVPATLSLSVNILDRYMSRRIVHARHFQLLGCVCLWLSAKTIDDKHNVPTTATLAYLCAKTYAESMFRDMELHVLTTLEWDILAPIAPDFIDLSVAEIARTLNSEALNPESTGSITIDDLSQFRYEEKVDSAIGFGSRDYAIVRSMAHYVCECALFARDFVGVRPSNLAASAVSFATTALEIIQLRGWPAVYPRGSSKDCFNALVALVAQAPSECAARYSGEDQLLVSQLFERFYATYSALKPSHYTPCYLATNNITSEHMANNSVHPATPTQSRHSTVNFSGITATSPAEADTARSSRNDSLVMPLTPDADVLPETTGKFSRPGL